MKIEDILIVPLIKRKAQGFHPPKRSFCGGQARLKAQGFKEFLSALGKEGKSIGEMVEWAKGYLKDASPKERLYFVLKNIDELDNNGSVRIRFKCMSKELDELQKGMEVIRLAGSKDERWWNLIGYEHEWDIFGDDLDFLMPDSPFRGVKEMERDIYLEDIGPILESLSNGATVLDAGCGVGRFAGYLSGKGFSVTIVDSSPSALWKALRNTSGEGEGEIDAYWADTGDMGFLSDDTFDAVLAIELLCYHIEPARVMRELKRVLKSNGFLILSVEGKYGGMLGDKNHTLDTLRQTFTRNILSVPNHLYVRYYTPEDLRRLIEESGLEVISITGSHYVTDGIFHKLINESSLDDPEYRDIVMDLERRCKDDPVLYPLARAWTAVARKR